jgi:transcription elongation factor GreB
MGNSIHVNPCHPWSLGNFKYLWLELGMSKAFTRESDDAPDLPVRPGVSNAYSAGKNYLTERGALLLTQELDRLREVERPKLAASAEDSETKRQLRLIDARIAQITNCLQTAVVVRPPDEPDGTVRFGATVTVRHSDGELAHYRIVGADETDLEPNSISWASPIAKALLNATVGAKVSCRNPSGTEEIEILEVKYV